MKEPIENSADYLADKIETLVAGARRRIVTAVNSAQVYTYFEIGRYIVEEEQGGKLRAEYGKGILKKVSERLTERLGKGWSVDTLENAKKFFLLYSDTTAIENRKRINLCTVDTQIQEQDFRDCVSEIEYQEIQTSGLEIQKSEPLVRKSEEIDSVSSGYPIQNFPLSWSHYLILCPTIRSLLAR